jgi:hypothetical protein
MGSPASASEPATRRLGNATTEPIFVQVCWMGITLAAGLLEQPVAYIEYSCIYMEQFVLLEKVYEG